MRALQLRGIVRYGFEDFFGSLRDLNHYVENEKVDSLGLAQAYRFIGNDYYRLGKYDSALIKINSAFSYDSLNGRLYFDRADIEVALNNETTACKDYSKALELGVFEAAEEIKKICN